jgi:hypothetical protein
MSMPSKGQIGWGIVVVVMVLTSLFFGVKLPIPPAPEPTPVVVEPEQPAAAVSDKYIESLIVDKELTSNGTTVLKNTTVGGALTVTGAITGGSFSPATFTNATDLIANTGQFTTSLKVALTPVARLSGSAIDAASLKVAATPVALLSGSTINGAAVSVAGTPVVVQTGALAAGARLVCGSTTITGTGTLPHALATPQYVQLSLGQNVTGDCTNLSYTNTSATVTAKCFNSALTPAPATTPAAVNWCVIGKP